jgi:uncharacterized protein HemX
MSDRAQRREEIKLALEYAKLALSLVGLSAIVFAGLQWRVANQVADNAIYQRMAGEWRDHLKTFVDKPDLRPYFESKRPVAPSDEIEQAVLAVADVRLDVADAILTYAALRGYRERDITGWRTTFANAFRTSPVLCTRIAETRANYGFIVPIATEACPR